MVSTVVGDQTGSPCIAYLFAFLIPKKQTIKISLMNNRFNIELEYIRGTVYINKHQANKNIQKYYSIYKTYITTFFFNFNDKASTYIRYCYHNYVRFHSFFGWEIKN